MFMALVGLSWGLKTDPRVLRSSSCAGGSDYPGLVGSIVVSTNSLRGP